MLPVLFRIGDFPVTSFGLMMFLAFLIGAWVWGRQLERYGLDRALAWDMLAWIAIGGIIGAKAYYLALHWSDVVANPVAQIFSRGGLVWYGGLIGGVTAYWLQIRSRKLPLGVMFDATAPALLVGHAVGRLGCFLVGDDYGLPTDSWVGIAFPDGSPPSTAGYFRSIGVEIPAGIGDAAVLAVHPTQLYEMGLALLLFVFLWRMGARRLHQGQLFSLYLGLYGIARFGIEIVRAKSDRIVAGLSTSQLMSVLLIVVGVVLWYRQQRAPLSPTPAEPIAVKPPKPAKGRIARRA